MTGADASARRLDTVRQRVLPAARRRLDAARGRGWSALNLPVPEAESLTGGGHITLLTPFAPRHRLDASLVGELRSLMSAVPPFDFELDRLGRFPQGVLYLAPTPVEPFVSLVGELRRRWPEYEPYGGVHDEVVPHLTVWFARLGRMLVSGRDAEPEGLAVALEGRLPVRCTARAVDLVVMTGPRRWEALARLPLGETAAGSAAPARQDSDHR